MKYAENLQLQLFDAGKRTRGILSDEDFSTFFDEHMREAIYKMRGAGRTFTTYRGTESVESGARKRDIDPYLSGKPEPDSLRNHSALKVASSFLSFF